MLAGPVATTYILIYRKVYHEQGILPGFRRRLSLGAAFRSRQRVFDAGEIRLAILSLLSDGPKQGYQLMKEMSERSGGVYRASAASIYLTLQQLEDEKLVKAALVSGRRTYTLTKAGRKKLEDDPETVRRIWERAEACEDWSQCMAPESMMV